MVNVGDVCTFRSRDNAYTHYTGEKVRVVAPVSDGEYDRASTGPMWYCQGVGASWNIQAFEDELTAP